MVKALPIEMSELMTPRIEVTKSQISLDLELGYSNAGSVAFGGGGLWWWCNRGGTAINFLKACYSRVINSEKIL
jgi:hypothetical protein